MTRVWLDDERDPPCPRQDWVICRSFQEFNTYILDHGIPDFVSFDHDLGNPILDGLRCAKMMVELYLDGVVKWPQKFHWYVHSANPIGRENIEGYLNSWISFKRQHDEG